MIILGWIREPGAKRESFGRGNRGIRVFLRVICSWVRGTTSIRESKVNKLAAPGTNDDRLELGSGVLDALTKTIAVACHKMMGFAWNFGALSSFLGSGRCVES
jgi:hypothetical protein